jgi:chromosome segregation ATPase
MVRIEELEQRVREVGSEVEGEKLVTRRLYDQAVRTADQVGALRSEVGTARVDIQAVGSQVDHMAHEVVQVSAALRTHGLRLESLTRDIGLLRNDASELRRGQEEIHVRLDRHEERLDALQAAVDAVRAGQEEIHVRLTRYEERLGALQAGQDEIHRKLDALIAAVAPRGPAP